MNALLVSCTGENAPSSSLNQTESLAGVGADANGVRDDADRYIDTTYAGQASADLNKAVQASLVHTDSQTQSLIYTTERFRALECLMVRRSREFHTIFVDVRAQLLNTPSRRQILTDMESSLIVLADVNPC